MCKPITEKEILHSEMTAAPVNNARLWYRDLNFIINNEAINYDVKITFTTKNGNRKVNTHIVAVIENYVKINEGVIIPLSSITKIDFKEEVIVIKDDHERIWVLIFLVLGVLVCIAIVYFIAR